MKLALVFFLLLGATFAQSIINNEKAFLSIQNRIVGGVIANPAMFPYMATLFITKANKDGDEYENFCGGSLISDRFILTAGHCLIKGVRAKVYLGAHDLSRRTEPGRIEIIVQKDGIILYDKYNPAAYEDDIALIKLPRRVNFTRGIQPVTLPSRSQTNIEGQGAVITGWGNINNREGSEILRYAQVRILEDKVCQSFFKQYYHSTNICLDGKGKSGCFGDSGGPAVIIDREDNLYTQVGVTSYGSPWGCEKGHPFAYAKVSSFLDWIHEQTGIQIRE